MVKDGVKNTLDEMVEVFSKEGLSTFRKMVKSTKKGLDDLGDDRSGWPNR